MSETPVLTGSRVTLRGWQDADCAPFAALNADPVVMEHFPAPLSRKESDDFVARVRTNWAETGLSWWAAEVADLGFIGFVGLSRPKWEASCTPCVEIGWRLARQAWGHGYASEGARLALRYGFETLDLDEIVSFTIPANVRSQAVMQRLGMTRDMDGDFEHPLIPEDSPVRTQVLYRLRRAEWAAQQKA